MLEDWPGLGDRSLSVVTVPLPGGSRPEIVAAGSRAVCAGVGRAAAGTVAVAVTGPRPRAVEPGSASPPAATVPATTAASPAPVVSTVAARLRRRRRAAPVSTASVMSSPGTVRPPRAWSSSSLTV